MRGHRVLLSVPLCMLALLAGQTRAAAAPSIDPASVVVYLDEGRLELEGDGLRNLRVRWNGPAGAGSDVCLTPKPSGKRERCAFSLPHDLPLDVPLAWAPPAPATPPQAPAGGPAGEPFQPLRPARIVIDRVFPAATTALDLTGGRGRLPLAHPQAIAAVDCAQARCEIEDAAVEVAALSGSATSLTVHAHLAPHVFVQRGDSFESTFTQSVAVLHCPASIVSGAPLRRADTTSVVVRLDGRCGGDPHALR